MPENANLAELAASVVNDLRAASKRLATAESCTGGWIAKAITDIPGSSDVLGYGIVSYSNEAKQTLLGVAAETLTEHGAVSEPCVLQMASGVLDLSGAELAVAVSGVAGPGGGSDAKPVGTVWFGWADRSAAGIASDAECLLFEGDRHDVRRKTVQHALQGIRDRLSR